MRIKAERSLHRVIIRAMRIIEAARLVNIQIVKGCAEPGYEDTVMALGNWNDTPKRVSDLLERAGVECEWEDEWSVCDDCCKAVRTEPDSYGWRRYYAIDDDGIHCGDCIKDDVEGYLESLEGRDDKAVTINGINPAEHGYHKMNKDAYECGLRKGQHDDPKAIARRLRANGVRRFIFTIDNVDQFDMQFSVWAKNAEEDIT